MSKCCKWERCLYGLNCIYDRDPLSEYLCFERKPQPKRKSYTPVPMKKEKHYDKKQN